MRKKLKLNTMKNPEIIPGPKKSKEFDRIIGLMGEKNYIEGASAYGAVRINRWPDDSIEISVQGQDGINTRFTVSEDMAAYAVAKKPTIKKHSRDGGGLVKHQYPDPAFSLDDLLVSFTEKIEAAK